MRLPTTGIHLEVAEHGPADGPPVLLLHGFPETMHCWRFQVPALAEAGYRVITPNLRGYGKSDKPPRIRDYGLDLLADDVAGLLDHYGIAEGSVVGHDWGAAVTWHFARRHPQRARRVAVLNCPPAEVVVRAALTRPSQGLRAYHGYLFQLPWLPQRLLAARDFALPWRGMAGTSARPGAFTREDKASYVAAWREPGSLTAMINYYRAAVRDPRGTPRVAKAVCPVLLVWGTGDHVLQTRLIDECAAYAEDLRVRRLDGVSHWVNVDAPEQVNEALLAFLGD